MKFNLTLCLLILLMSMTSCSNTNKDIQSPQPEQPPAVTLFEADGEQTTPSGTTYKIFKGWSQTQEGNNVRLESPEGDVHIGLYESDDPDAMNAMMKGMAWLLPGIQAKSIGEMHVGNVGDGWEDMIQILYKMEEKPEAVLIANARKCDNHWYVTIIEGDQAGVAKRSAQTQTIYTSVRPKNFRSPGSLADKGAAILDDAAFQELEKFAISLQENFQIPGFAIGIVQNGKIVYEKGFGVRELGKPDPVTADTLFMLGSVSKMLTGYMIARLVENNKLTWDTPILTLWPEFKTADENLTNQLTLKLALSNSTGIPRSDMDIIFEYQGATPEITLKRLQNIAPTTGIGETFQYSNDIVSLGGYTAAKYIHPESNFEEAFQKTIDEYVLKPLKMDASTYKNQDALKTNHATSHSYFFNLSPHPIDMGLEDFINAYAPAGGLWSTVGDMCRYIIAELAANTPADQIRRQKFATMSNDTAYGLGMIISSDRDVKQLSHNGMTIGASALLVINPDHNLGYVIVNNASYGANFNLLLSSKLFDFLYQTKDVDYYEPLFVEKLKEAIDQRNEQIKNRIFDTEPDTEWLKTIEGSYNNDALGKVTISIVDGKGIFDAGEWKTPIGKAGNNILLLLEPPLTGIAMKISRENDKVVSITLEDAQKNYIFNKIQ